MIKPYTKSVRKLIDHFSKMPGIGAKSAEKLALYILKTPKDEAMDLAYAIRDVKKNIRTCDICYNLSESEVCDICADHNRDKSLICIVEYPRDLIAIEKTGAYKGQYHVLMGKLSPVDGMDVEQLKIDDLLKRLNEDVKEIILATNPTVEGDNTAGYLQKILAEKNIKLTRIARGMPSGYELDFAGANVVSDAILRRHEI